MTKVQRAKNRINVIQNKIDGIVTVRWILFLLATFDILYFWGSYHRITFQVTSSLIVAVFIITSFIHSSLSKRLLSWEQYLGLLELEENRKRIDWTKLPSYTSPDLSSEEFDLITATDLHLIGPNSALQLIDSCISDFGQKTLVSYLLSEVSLAEIEKRQSKIKALLPLQIFRMKFKLLGRIHSNVLINRESLFSIFSMEVFKKKFFAIFTVLVIVQVLNTFLIIGATLGLIKPYFLLSFLIILLLYQLLKNQSDNAFEVGLQLQITLERVLPLFQIMEHLPVAESEALHEEFLVFKESPPSKLLKKINVVVALLSVRANPMLKLILNYLLPWDFGLLIILENLKSKHYEALKKWMDSLGRVEALISLADYSQNSGGTFPMLLREDAGVILKAQNLSHPLMLKEKSVPNSYQIDKSSPFAVITGSNMAGKSTFLRTIGINVSLARAGVSVRADDFQLQNLTVMSLIKAQDFLEKEMSLFYFEVKRLKDILDEGRERTSISPLLFLVDEIYRGTNNQERYQGAVAYLKEFSKIPNCCGLLTTHDINIAKDLQNITSIKQYHFSELFAAGELQYDYKIHPGICETTNALRIMAQEGLPT